VQGERGRGNQSKKRKGAADRLFPLSSKVGVNLHKSADWEEGGGVRNVTATIIKWRETPTKRNREQSLVVCELASHVSYDALGGDQIEKKSKGERRMAHGEKGRRRIRDGTTRRRFAEEGVNHR